MSTPNPLGPSGKRASGHSQTTFLIGGIPVHVHGLHELSSNTGSVAVLWLHHPRLSNAGAMTPLASHILSAYAASPSSSSLGLLIAAFDQRNHGERQHSNVANQAWRDGNERHALDMFSIYHGTMLDTRQMIDYFPSYVFPRGDKRVVEHLTLGISLGGHAVWHCLLHEPRISAGVVVIGIPDYANLMYDRARLSKRRTWTASEGKEFFGSEDFPANLVERVRQWDPAGMFLGSPGDRLPDLMQAQDPSSEEERRKLAEKLKSHLGGKRIQILTGGSDKLVPGKLGTPFVNWLKKAIGHADAFTSGSPPQPQHTPTSPSSHTAQSEEWKAGAGSGWMANSAPGPGSVPEKWHSAEWKAGAGSGWMVSSEPEASRVPAKWHSAEWKAGAGSGWMVDQARDASRTGPASPRAAPGWAADTAIVLEDLTFDGTGHEFSTAMCDEATRFLVASLEEMAGLGKGDRRRRGSRM